jgi:AcrR family transcriptional regulator
MTAITKPATREKLTAAALELFTAQGYERTSVHEICQQSGVSNGSFFHHFGSKEGLALEVYLKERRSYWDAAVTAMERHADDPVEGVVAAMRAALDYQEANPDRHNFMIECANANWMRAHAAAVTELNVEFAVRFLHWAEPHMEAGRLQAHAPEVIAALVFGPSQWLTRSWHTGLSETPPTAYADALGMLLRRALAAQEDEV